jgi:hypothetical protein
MIMRKMSPRCAPIHSDTDFITRCHRIVDESVNPDAAINSATRDIPIRATSEPTLRKKV